MTTQCRAVAVCKDALLHDLDTWMERSHDDAGDRMLLSQAERKAASMGRELDALEAAERRQVHRVFQLKSMGNSGKHREFAIFWDVFSILKPF